MFVGVDENLLPLEILVNFVHPHFILLLMEANANLVQPTNTLKLALVLVPFVAQVIKW